MSSKFHYKLQTAKLVQLSNFRSARSITAKNGCLSSIMIVFMIRNCITDNNKISFLLQSLRIFYRFIIQS